MKRRRNRYGDQVSLPWEVEIPVGLISLLAVPLAMKWIVWRITSPISHISEAIGVPIDLQKAMEPLHFGIWAFGFLAAIKVWLFLRGWISRRITDLLI